ncbi:MULTISPECIES: hypothetical protein [unclassified Pseudovibrio]|uniref:hypothetical protein n=1 Tax=unclassified Pseudovibrio TaxID=2627060 RepID=UPI00070CA3B8|nr:MULTISPECIES: hypothetical protein [unclassified Pseudovibrio]KZL27032.1 hypothetical protein PsWM33_01116 [Pseudovibrio sp. WM33]
MRLELEANPVHVGLCLTKNPAALAELLSAMAASAPDDLATKVNQHMPSGMRDRTADLLEKLLLTISAFNQGDDHG